MLKIYNNTIENLLINTSSSNHQSPSSSVNLGSMIVGASASGSTRKSMDIGLSTPKSSSSASTPVSGSKSRSSMIAAAGFSTTTNNNNSSNNSPRSASRINASSSSSRHNRR